jgi:Fe2+ transport system protein B
MYFVGIVLIFLGALLVNKVTGYKFRKSFFIMELPEYKIPSLKRATLSMLGRGKAYIIKAGTIILVCNAVVQIMQSFNWQLQAVEEGMEHTSILATIASPFAVLLIPAGFGAWQLAAAAITGFIAKENVVGTLAVVYGLTNFIDTEELALTLNGKKNRLKRSDFETFGISLKLNEVQIRKAVQRITDLIEKFLPETLQESFLPEDMQLAVNTLITERIARIKS